jgi:pimeloyl-ACP methyl ester carboxylesterase
MATRQLEIRGLTFDLRVDGPATGPPAVLLHGFPQNARAWDGVISCLTGSGLRTIAIDQRGYSPRARPSNVADYAIGELVADVLAVMDALEIPSATIAGHDWGAVVAWALALAAPARVHGLVAISVPHPDALSNALAADPDQQRRSAYIRLFRQEGTAEAALTADHGAALRAFFAGSRLSAAEIDAYVQPLVADPAALTAALNWYRAATPPTHDAGAVTVPTTFVWSDGDIALGRTAAEDTVNHVTGRYEFVELAGHSHWLLEEAPEKLAEVIAQRSR